jgi:hypothetical protein
MSVRRESPLGGPMDLPFLHLRGGNIDAGRLTATTHSEIHVKGCQTLANITLRDDVESS